LLEWHVLDSKDSVKANDVLSADHPIPQNRRHEIGSFEWQTIILLETDFQVNSGLLCFHQELSDRPALVLFSQVTSLREV
jgi:hypothetical protein